MSVRVFALVLAVAVSAAPAASQTYIEQIPPGARGAVTEEERLLQPGLSGPRPTPPATTLDRRPPDVDLGDVSPEAAEEMEPAEDPGEATEADDEDEDDLAP